MLFLLRRGSMTCAAGLACTALLISCGSKSAPESLKTNLPAREVELAPAVMRLMEKVVPVTGTLEAQERSILSAKVSGRLEKITVDVGSTVAKGDLLAQIEPRDYDLALQQALAALAQARAALGLDPASEKDSIPLEDVSGVKQAFAVLQEARNNRERVHSLGKSGVAPQSELDTAEATYMVALTRHEAALEEARSRMATVAERRAAVELARKRLADTALRAPFDGAVQARPAGLGEYVAAGTPTIELVKTDPLRLRLGVPELYANQVRPGQQIRLLPEGLIINNSALDTARPNTNHYYTGCIARISPALDEQSRMLFVEADVPAQGSLRPGLFARAELVISESEPGLAVPVEAVTTFAGLEKVLVEQNGKAVEKLVTTGRRGSNWVEIVSGLTPGDSVMLNPAGLRTGSPVTVGKGPLPQSPPAQARSASDS